jgi:HSP20 family protein
MNQMTKQENATPTTQRGNGVSNQVDQFVQPRASVYEAAEAVILELEMPGVSRDKIDVTVEKDELTVTGWRHAEDYQKYEVIHQERLPLSFRRSFVLGDTIDADNIGAALNNGVLRLSLPKSERAKPKKISID